MRSIILASSFATAIAVSGIVVLLFSKSIDHALARVIPGELASEWGRFVKLAIFTAALFCGEFAQFIRLRAPGDWPPEFFNAMAKAILGSMAAVSSLLFVVLGTALAVHASTRARGLGRPPAGAERQPVGADRHAAAKERQRTEEPGRYL